MGRSVVSAVQADGAQICLDQAGDQVETGRLPAPLGPNTPISSATPHLEIDVAQDHHLPSNRLPSRARLQPSGLRHQPRPRRGRPRRPRPPARRRSPADGKRARPCGQGLRADFRGCGWLPRRARARLGHFSGVNSAHALRRRPALGAGHRANTRERPLVRSGSSPPAADHVITREVDRITSPSSVTRSWDRPRIVHASVTLRRLPAATISRRCRRPR